MGSQVPDNVVRFDASFGRRLLYDPAYNKAGPICRCAWFEANLIATEFDGKFPIQALEQRLMLMEQEPDHILTRLFEIGLFVHDDDPEWALIAGWDKWQPDPLQGRGRPLTGAERTARHRAKKRGETPETPVTEPVTPVTPVTPRAGASSSSSSSVSKKPSRKRVREENGSGNDPTPGEAKAILEKYGYKPGEHTS